jgi:hypothetical protein
MHVVYLKVPQDLASEHEFSEELKSGASEWSEQSTLRL